MTDASHGGPAARSTAGRAARWTRFLAPALAGLAWLALFFLVLEPFLTNGYYSDDAIEGSTLHGALTHTPGESIGRRLLSTTRDYYLGDARLTPVGYGGFLLGHYLFHSLRIYRLAHVLSVLANVLCAMYAVARVSRVRSLGFLLGITVLACFQMRNYHDPISCFGFIAQMSLGFGAGSAYLLFRHLETGRRAPLAASAAFYLLAILDYEYGLSYLAACFAVVLLAPSRAGKWRTLFPHAALTALFLIAVIAQRLRIPAIPYQGLRLGSAGRFAATYLAQVTGAFPLSHVGFDPQGLFSPPARLIDALSWPSALAFLLGGGLTWTALRRLRTAPPPAHRPTLVALSLVLLLVPAAFIALSSKYQEQLTLGIAYLPVYMAYFGLALLLCLGAAALVARPARAPLTAALLSLAVGGAIAVNLAANRIVQRKMDSYWKYPRTIFEEALATGLLDGLPPAATVVPAREYNWLARPATADAFFLTYAGRTARKQSFHEFLTTHRLGRERVDLRDQGYFLADFEGDAAGGGWCILSAVAGIAPSEVPGAPYRITGSGGLVFVAAPAGDLAGRRVVTDAYRAELAGLPRVASSRFGLLLRLPERPFDVSAIQLQ